MSVDVEYPMTNETDDILKTKLYLVLILFDSIKHSFSRYSCHSFTLLVSQLPADIGTGGVRAEIPAPGRDRDVAALLSEINRDLTAADGGLGRAKNK